MRWATRASVAVATTLVATKAVAWWASGSVAMLGSLADSTLDLAVLLVTLFAVRTALVPPDDDHRFGHGKAEALAGLFQAAIMSGSSVFLLLESVQRIADPAPVSQSALVMGISGLAIVLSFALVMFQSYVVRHTGSLAIAGDHLHYKGDLLLNLSVIGAAWATASGFPMADGIFGIMIAAYILYGAYDIVRPAIDMLMDRELLDGERERIFNIVMENPDVVGLHELKTRLSGRDFFVQMHIEVDGTMEVSRAHMVTSELEATIGEAFPGSQIFIHVDPAGWNSDQLTARELKKEA
jgi:ferrous-iron efflux pump FieF